MPVIKAMAPSMDISIPFSSAKALVIREKRTTMVRRWDIDDREGMAVS